MATSFTLPDAASLGDLRTYLGRAARIEDGSVRLIADSGVLAVYTAILYPVGLLDDDPWHRAGCRAHRGDDSGAAGVDPRRRAANTGANGGLRSDRPTAVGQPAFHGCVPRQKSEHQPDALNC